MKDHRPGEVSESEGVLSIAHPNEAVCLLGKLGGERRDEKREDERRYVDEFRDREQLLDHQVGTADDQTEPEKELHDDH